MVLLPKMRQAIRIALSLQKQLQKACSKWFIKQTGGSTNDKKLKVSKQKCPKEK